MATTIDSEGKVRHNKVIMMPLKAQNMPFWSDTAERAFVHRSRAGVLAGIFGCLFGLLGIFSLGFVFVPLAALCSLVGLIRGLFGVSALGTGMSLLAAFLTVLGFATSPSLWVITAGALVAANAPGRTVHIVEPFAGEAQTQAVHLNHLQQWTEALNSATAAGNADLPKFQPIEDKYRALTEWMNAALARQRSISGSDQAFVIRNQIGVAINQAGVAAEQLHVALQGSEQDTAVKIQQVDRAIANFTSLCQPTDKLNNLDLQMACSKFLDAADKFKVSTAKLGHAFDHAEKVWVEEHNKQGTIIRASDIASR